MWGAVKVMRSGSGLGRERGKCGRMAPYWRYAPEKRKRAEVSPESPLSSAPMPTPTSLSPDRACRRGRRCRGARGHSRDLVLDRGVASPQDQTRIKGEGDDAGDERGQDGRVAERDLARLEPLGPAAVHRSLEEADGVEGRQRDADPRDERVDDLRLEDT